MPANPERKMIAIRLHRETIAQLNALCGAKMRGTGRKVHRSEMIGDLIAKAHTKLKR